MRWEYKGIEVTIRDKRSPRESGQFIERAGAFASV